MGGDGSRGWRDEAAFEAVCVRLRPELRRHLLDILRDSGAADDLVQEVLLRLWTADPPPAPAGVRAWLHRVATNLALNQLRTARRRPAEPLDPGRLGAALRDGGVPAAGALAATPEAAFERAETAGLCRRAVADLPAAHRAVVALVYEADLRLRDVAEVLGVPEGTVKSRLHAARRQLSRRWRELAPDWEDDR
ncbi:MAG: RNA polymerase sigma factor [Armatimonadetes bacterium]|nr:RNA polymerase sigma factor [Armatimonadota bacterium]